MQTEKPHDRAFYYRFYLSQISWSESIDREYKNIMTGVKLMKKLPQIQCNGKQKTSQDYLTFYRQRVYLNVTFTSSFLYIITCKGLMYGEKERQLNMNIEDYKNLSTLLQVGKFSLTAQESIVLVNLVNKIGGIIKKMEAEPEEETKTE